MINIENKFDSITIGQILFNITSRKAELSLNSDDLFNKLNTKITGFIYLIKKVDEFTSTNIYVGRSGQKKTFSGTILSPKRFHHHVFSINKFSKKTISKSPNAETKKSIKLVGDEDEKLHKYLYKTLSNNNDSCFELVILDTATSLDELKQKEIDKIIECNTLHPKGKNMILGGGGFAVDENKYLPFESPGKKFATKAELKSSLTPGPKNSYPLIKNQDGSFFIPIPQEISELKNVVYRIKKMGACDKVLIGVTMQSFGERLSNYAQMMNNSDEPLYVDIRKNWKDYSVGVALRFEENVNPFEPEKYVIKKRKELFPHDEILNKTNGGNGGTAYRSPKHVKHAVLHDVTNNGNDNTCRKLF